MHHLSQAEPFPNLHKLQLGGLSLSIDDLLEFPQNHNASLREISLENVQAAGSLLAPLFEFLASQDCAVERIHLRDLQEDLRMLLFLPEQESQSTKLSGATRQLNVIDRWDTDVKLVIGCYTRTKRWRMVETEEASRANRWNAVAFGWVYSRWRSVEGGGYGASAPSARNLSISRALAQKPTRCNTLISFRDILLLTVEKMQAELENLTGDGGRRCCAEFRCVQ